jgi:hypothetical protein
VNTWGNRLKRHQTQTFQGAGNIARPAFIFWEIKNPSALAAAKYAAGRFGGNAIFINALPSANRTTAAIVVVSPATLL